ncbi:hypothetical protein LTR17_000454 [Elasticomyces elasticus]|nr:hypothetical protein LTR17_000454 [Elasticomyces elasticus]
MEQAPSLTTIAPELRNSIFELALHDVPEEIEIASSGRPMKQPGLLAVCHQIRSETLPVLQDLVARSAKRVVVRVRDLDFSAAMEFIDALTREQRDVVGYRASLLFKITVDESRGYRKLMGFNLYQWVGYIATKLHGTLAAHVQKCIAYDFSEVPSTRGSLQSATYWSPLLIELFRLPGRSNDGAEWEALLRGNTAPQVWITMHMAYLRVYFGRVYQ